MIHDVIDNPIVDEVHETRRRIMAECQDDLTILLARIRERQVRHGDKLVTVEESRRRRAIERAAQPSATE